MTNRPQPRRSTLAGQTPILPTPVTNRPELKSPSNAARARVSLYLPADLAAKARTAYMMDAANGGATSFSDWITRLIRTRIRQLEDPETGGRQIFGTPPGEIPTGRPVTLDKR